MQNLPPTSVTFEPQTRLETTLPVRQSHRKSAWPKVDTYAGHRWTSSVLDLGLGVWIRRTEPDQVKKTESVWF
ncbi:hypothetical protein RchiOBHm_Chr1g0350771 [Rosa chinensis]|uniref:Uncharacterized protein n=1 Tax=Rosa chinensis TaxID=74649 RepID=A0A2P6SG57_ROSCH|nr:hypothetical protein RchiOBHm_Chr1g0350771 [Rosa chinensis]